MTTETIATAETDLSYIPTGYHSIQPYLIVKDAPKAIAYYTEVFGAKERMRMKDDKGRVSHAELVIGDSVIMMADEHPEIEAFAPDHFGGSPINLMLHVKDCDTTYAKALGAGAKSLREPADQPYGDRMAGVLDPFGFKWWIAHPLAKAHTQSEESATP